MQKKLQRVELNFDVARGEEITFTLNAKDSKRLIAYLKDEEDCQVFFPDYEDEEDEEDEPEE